MELPLSAIDHSQYGMMNGKKTEQRLDYFWLVSGAVFLIVGLTLEPGPEHVTIFGWPIPEVCLYQRFLNVACLGCGLTRSTVYAIHGEPMLAFEHHFAGPILASFAVAQVLYRLWKMCA